MKWHQYWGRKSLYNLNVIYALFKEPVDNFDMDLNKVSSLHCHLMENYGTS